MDELKELAGLLERLEGKLKYTRGLIAEYEETMDYASHCNLLGFAEGIEFALEEIRENLKKKPEGAGKPKSKGGKRGGTR
jgi:hypothetical protein